MNNDRRTTMRLRTALPGRWKRGRRVIEARIGDINGNGMFLETDELIPTGQVMDLVIDLPSGPISFLAVSRSCGTTRQGRGIGLSIFAMERRDRSKWDNHYRVAMSESRRELSSSAAA